LTPINFDILSTDPMPTAPRKRQLRNISELGGTETSLKQRPAAERVAAQDARPASGDKQQRADLANIALHATGTNTRQCHAAPTLCAALVPTMERRSNPRMDTPLQKREDAVKHCGDGPVPLDTAIWILD
jgi:hypothetical protein